MNKSWIKGSVLVLSMGVSVAGWTFGPCMPIAKACMQQGSYASKKAMVKECILPVVQGKRTLSNASFTPQQIQQCQLEIKQKMQAKMGSM